MTSRWRDYRVHPSAKVFPMLKGEEMDALVADIAENGVREPVTIWRRKDGAELLIDGRNRLEGGKRAGKPVPTVVVSEEDKPWFDPVAFIISANVRRRHLTKTEQARLILQAVAAGEKPRKHYEVSKGGRGNIDKVKAAAVEIAKGQGISKRTVEMASRAPRQQQPPRQNRNREEPLNSLAWSLASGELRRKWISDVGVKSIFDAMTRDQQKQIYDLYLHTPDEPRGAALLHESNDVTTRFKERTL